MNRKEIVEVALCRACGSEPGEPCRSLKTGQSYGLSYVHSARDKPFRDAYRRGFATAMEVYGVDPREQRPE